jgi:hypothetical protein
MKDNAGTVENDGRVAEWLRELHLSAEREKNYRKEAAEVLKIYHGKRPEQDQFNILYSNTETLAPALYNSTPRPTVKRRFNDADPKAKAASSIVQRILQYHLDDGLAEYATFDSLIDSAVLHSLVPARGVTRFCYEAEIEKLEDGTEAVASEKVYGKSVAWDHFHHGYGKTWEEVPWVAFDHFMTKDEVEKNFPEKLHLLTPKLQRLDEEDERHMDPQLKGHKVVKIVEIWDKVTKMQYFLCPEVPEAFLREPAPDPYKLSGFFPCPKPLMLFNSIGSCEAIPLYRLYKAQAEELNVVTVRIQRITKALKVRGFFDASVQGIEKLMDADDNTLLPMENAAALYGSGTGGGLDKAILLLPIEKLVSVLQQLYTQRDQVKRTIYEITGIADIMRGVSQASETLGAQELKNQWGTLRLKRFQRRTALYVRNCLRMLAELSVENLSQPLIASITGLQFPTAEEKAQAQVLIQAIQLQGGQPDPMTVQILQQPSWEELLELLKSDLQRSYRIDIETNSTLDAEATEDKQDIQELLTGLSQFFAAVSPMVESGTLPFDVAKGMLVAITRRYRLGPEFEDELNKMQPPQPPADPAAELKKLELQAKQAEMEHDKEMRALDMQLKREEFALKQADMQQKGELAKQKHVMDLQKLVLTAQVQSQKPDSDAD